MKHPLRLCAVFITGLCTAIVTMAGASSVAAATLNVANDGADSATCGAETSPCRSISQAIANASDGDTIAVGAGRYGNISGNPNFVGPGDEQPMATSDGTQGCILCITKAVHIFSLHGAAATIIQGNATSPYRSNVMIMRDGVIFGRAGGGFTITGGNDTGLTIVDQVDSLKSVTVAGNVDVGDGTGFLFFGVQFHQIIGCPDGYCLQTAQFVLSDNQAISNGVGFNLTVNVDGGPGQLIVQNNSTVGAGTGFVAIPGGCGACQFAGNAPANIVQLIDNVASNGGIGFATNLSGRIVGNTAIGNSQAGFLLTPGYSQVFQSNSAIGNGGPGVIVEFSPDEQTLQEGTFAAFNNNNFYGNDRNRPVFSISPVGWPINISSQGGYTPGQSAHCGLLNVGALAALTEGGQVTPPVIKLTAAGNFWGSAGGPQAAGPGDAVGGACDQNSGVTSAKPFATAPFGITSWP